MGNVQDRDCCEGRALPYFLFFSWKAHPESGVPGNNMGGVFFDRGMLEEAQRMFDVTAFHFNMSQLDLFVEGRAPVAAAVQVWCFLGFLLFVCLNHVAGVASNLMAVRKMTAQVTFRTLASLLVEWEQWDYYDEDMQLIKDLVAQGGEEVFGVYFFKRNGICPGSCDSKSLCSCIPSANWNA